MLSPYQVLLWQEMIGTWSGDDRDLIVVGDGLRVALVFVLRIAYEVATLVDQLAIVVGAVVGGEWLLGGAERWQS